MITEKLDRNAALKLLLIFSLIISQSVLINYITRAMNSHVAILMVSLTHQTDIHNIENRAKQDAVTRKHNNPAAFTALQCFLESYKQPGEIVDVC